MDNAIWLLIGMLSGAFIWHLATKNVTHQIETEYEKIVIEEGGPEGIQVSQYTRNPDGSYTKSFSTKDSLANG
jgi:hypothetical protein